MSKSATPHAPYAAPPARPSSAGLTWLKRLALIALGAVLGGGAVMALLAAAWWPRSEVLFRDSQPAQVSYPDGSRHHLGLVRQSSMIEGDTYALIVGRDPSLAYGHRVRILITGGTTVHDVDATEWTTAGVRVRFGGGHEVFVPARYFRGGR